MVYHLPKDGTEWLKLQSTLKSVAQKGCEISPTDLSHVLRTNYASFTGLAETDKFDDVEAMFAKVVPGVSSQFLSNTFARMCHDLLDWIPAATSPVPYLHKDVGKCISFSPLDAYMLNSMCFLGIPLLCSDGRNTMRYGSCSLLFTDRPKQVAKLSCLLNYFNVIVACKSDAVENAVKTQVLDRVIQITRIVSENTHGGEWWCNQTDVPLVSVQYMEPYDTIESAVTALQADFANKHIGGGVLRKGAVQEEIRFLISPECLLSVYLTDPLQNHEAVLISDTIRFSVHTGYSHSFKYEGISTSIQDVVSGIRDDIPREEILCIDATPFGFDTNNQYSLSSILRELEKCRIGLSSDSVRSKTFATGNWGCGVFGGDPQLKAVIQWLASSVSGRSVLYYPFDNADTTQLPELVAITSGKSVGVVFQALVTILANDRLKPRSCINELLEFFRNG